MLKIVAPFIAAGLVMSGVNTATATTTEFRSIGGVNLNHYCKVTYGGAFKSKLIGRTAGDWTCEQSAGNRRPISVEKACLMQYRKPRLKAKAMNWSDPYSWRCMQTVRVPEVKGVNLNHYCKVTYGGAFKSKLIGRTAGDWTCEQSAGNRRPISVKQACVIQYRQPNMKAKALKWSDPYSWRCIF
jgi:hypothetical protein